MINSLHSLNNMRENLIKNRIKKKIMISIGMSTCGIANGAEDIYNEIKKLNDNGTLNLNLFKTGCIGFCSNEPIINIIFPGEFIIALKNMTIEKIKKFLINMTPKNINIKDIMCIFKDTVSEKSLNSISNNFKKYIEEHNIPYEKDIPFFKQQLKLITRNSGIINPDEIEDYILSGGYNSLCKIIETISPSKVIDEVKKSDLRGRSGSGFKTGLKWELCSKSDNFEKFVICNADEGDPGSYVNRILLEGDPHLIIEGMLICAYAIGGNTGYIYIRKEYPNSIKIMKKAISDARNYGFIGKNILNRNFDFDIEIREGANAYICGEETSLISSIEGNSIEPRQKPPFPGIKGLFDKPTNINNVETFANIPIIFKDDNEEPFSKIGTLSSKGTKMFSIVGDITNQGVIEVPFGITLKDIIYNIGEGIKDNKMLKAIQPGGHFGGFIPAEMIDIKIDFHEFHEKGFSIGSGGIIILDESKSVIETAKFFLSFIIEESCGKCTSCRDGTLALLEILDVITKGQGKQDDLEILQEICDAIIDASFCGLGQTAPNPVLSTLKYFKSDYLKLIKG